MAATLRTIRRTVLLYVRDVILTDLSVEVKEGYSLPDETVTPPIVATWIARNFNTQYGVGDTARLYSFNCVLDIFAREDGERDTLGSLIFEKFMHRNTRMAVSTSLLTTYDANPTSKLGDLYVEHDTMQMMPLLPIGDTNPSKRHHMRLQCVMTLVTE
jgi:hypothetical protein